MARRPRALDAALTAVDGFTALTAIGGGVALITGMEGERFELELLDGTPFDSYAVPGLFLSGVVGGSAACATIAVLYRPRLGARLSELAGGVLVGWIAGEVILLRSSGARSWVETAYFAIGSTMIALGLARERASAGGHW